MNRTGPWPVYIHIIVTPRNVTYVVTVIVVKRFTRGAGVVLVTAVILILDWIITNSAVPAWLGLKALALAWPKVASAFSNPRPGQSHETWLGPAQAPAFVCEMYNFFFRLQESYLEQYILIKTLLSMKPYNSLPISMVLAMTRPHRRPRRGRE